MTSIDTVSDLPPRVQYVASASQTVFPYPFPIFDDADLVVDRDGVTAALGVDYTVAGEGDDTGGDITWIGAAFAGGEIVTIYRDIEIARDTDISQNGPWSSSAYNNEQDKVFLILQQLKAQLARSLRLPIIAEVDDADIELEPANFANTYLSFDADGKPTPALLSATTMTQATIGALLYPRTAAEISAAVTPTYYNVKPYNVMRYGVVGDGVSTDTTAIATAISATPAGGTLTFEPGNTYKVGQIHIAKNLHVIAEGAAFVLTGDYAGVLVDGVVTSGSWRGGTLTGDGVNRDGAVATAQKAFCIGNTTGSQVSNWRIVSVTAKSCNVGFEFADGRGSGGTKTLNCSAINCTADTMVGHVGGVGYGFQGTQADGLDWTGNIAKDCERHGFYFSEGKNYTAASNKVLGGGFGAVRGGFVISRSANAVVAGLLVAGRNDVGLVIDTDTQGLAPDNICNGIVVTGYVGHDNDLGDIKVGTSAPATDGVAVNVSINGVTIRAKSGASTNSIIVTSGNGVSITGINIDASAAAANQRAVSLSGESSAAYTNDVVIGIEQIKLPSSGYGISVASALCTGASKIRCEVKNSSGTGVEYEFGSGEDGVTNTSLWYRRSNGRSGRNYASSGTNVVIPLGGITDLTLSASGATTIANFTGGREGDLINIFFANGNSTLKSTNFYTAGAVDFVGTTSDMLTMQYRSGAWRECYRSVN